MTVTVIVCAHNEARYLRGCLYSLLARSCVPDEILVIDNASTHETRAVAEQVPGMGVLHEHAQGRDQSP